MVPFNSRIQIYIKANSKMVSFMDMELTLAQIITIIQECGRMIRKIFLVYSFIIMAIDMKENITKINNNYMVPLFSEMKINCKLNTRMIITMGSLSAKNLMKL